MLTIHKITSNHVIDFAAEELKKYLRMMMPRAGEVAIDYAPEAKDGFRLGLMADFGLSTDEAEDPELDDILHIDTTEDGGIIAGSNPRSVLLAVYRYLRENGCRWLFPGVDGEYIPIRNIEPVQFHKMADMRYRGQCNEGGEFQPDMIEAIDFTPKIGLNIFMLEFDNPYTYYEKYYNHLGNPSREPEPISYDTALQWKRACEAEIAKRGLELHDMGHGWTAEPFGISSVAGWDAQAEDGVPEEARQYLALINGKRQLWKGVALNTNFCMSNPKARGIVANAVKEYARKSTNVDYLHVWLADAHGNHCECDECRKKNPTDWYIMLANEIDAALTEAELDTRIAIISYTDTAWAPETERLNNPKRFVGVLGAITRSYCYSAAKDPVPENPVPYIRNDGKLPGSMEEYLWHAHNWMDRLDLRFFAYEYHFWKPQFQCPDCISFARRLYEDVRSYRENRFSGIVEDGSQRSFFPNGLSFTMYANTLFDVNTDFDAAVDDYFTHAYGEAVGIVKKFFAELAELLPQKYVESDRSEERALKKYHNPSMIPGMEQAIRLCEQLDADLKPYRNMPYRVQTVAVRLLSDYTLFWREIAKALIIKASGQDEEALAALRSALAEFGKKEQSIERYYDQQIARISLNAVFKPGTTEA